MKDNPFVLKRVSDLNVTSSTIHDIISKSKKPKHFETFVNSISSQNWLSETIQKIMNNSNSSRKHLRNWNDELRSYMTKKNLSPLVEDDLMIKKINLNKNKLRYDQELKELYDRKYELKSIDLEPVFHEYVGYTFRKWYQDASQSDSQIDVSWIFNNDESCNETRQENKWIVAENNCNIENVVDNNESNMIIENSIEKHTIDLLPELNKEWIDIHQKHLIESLQAYQYLNDLKAPEFPLMLEDSDKFENGGKKLLVFDMDETLIHCLSESEKEMDWDIRIPWRYSQNLEYKKVNIRPYVIEVLIELSKLFTIIVFTASTREYADPILNFLDKDFCLIKRRFYRHHWYRTKDQVTMKDLRIFEQCGYDLKDVILIDNATHWFGFQIDNGIPIIPFINNKDDKELVHLLLHFLQKLVDVEDVRPLLTQTFNLKHLRHPQILSKIDGVIEYQVEDVDDDYFNDNLEIKSWDARPTISEPTAEDIAEEIQEGFSLNSTLKYIPIVRPSHINPIILNQDIDANISKESEIFCKEICLDTEYKTNCELRNNQNQVNLMFEVAALQNDRPISMEFSQESYESWEIIETEVIEDFELL